MGSGSAPSSGARFALDLSRGLCGDVAREQLSPSQLLKQLEALAIGYDDISTAAAHLAGCIHWKYRQEGGPRTHLVPDFLIAAHAEVQCDRLAAIDRGYLRRYFPRLKLLRHS